MSDLSNMVELEVVVKEKGLKQSISLTDRLERQLNKAAVAIEKNAITQERYNKILLSAKREYETLGVSSQKATASVRKLAEANRDAYRATQDATQAAKAAAQEKARLAQADRDAAKAAKEDAAEKARLVRATEDVRRSISPLYAAQTAYIQKLQTLRTAYDQNVISSLEFSQAQEQLAKQAQRAGLILDKQRNVVGMSNKSMRQFELGVQQAGYQVGDFFVQIAGGTNPLIAFSQQASQLAGFFAGPWGAAIGAAIAIGAALAIAFQNWGGKAKELEDHIEDLNDAFDNLESVDLSEFVNNTNQGVQAVISKYSELIDVMNEVAAHKRDLAIGGIINEVIPRGELEDALFLLNEAQAQYDNLSQSTKENADVMTFINGELAKRQKAVDDLVNTEAILLSIGGKDRVGMAESLSLAIERLKANGLLSDTLRDKLVTLGNELGLQNAITGELEDTADAADDAAQAANKMADALVRANSAVSGLALDIEQKIAVVKAKNLALQNGTNSAVAGEIALLKEKKKEVIAEANAQAVANGVANTGITQQAEQIDILISELEKELVLNKELEDAQKKTRSSGKNALKEQLREAERLRKELEGPMVSAVESVGDAFGDFISRGLKDFDGFVSSILGSFQNMIAQMISMAVSNRIMLSLGIGGLTPQMAAAGQIAGLGGASTMLGSLGTGAGLAGLAGGTGFLGAAGNTVAGLSGGVGSFLSTGFGGLTSGISSAMGASSIFGAGGAISGLTSAVGSIVPVIGAVVAIGSLAKSLFGRKFKGSYLEGTVSNSGFDGFTRDFYKGGLFRSDKNEIKDLDSDLDLQINNTVKEMTSSLLEMGVAIGKSKDALTDYAGTFISLQINGKSQEEIQELLAEQMSIASDEMADLILGTTKFARAGETSTETLQRLGGSLLAVNNAIELIGGTSLDASARMGNIASKVVDLFGSLEDYSNSISAFYNSMFTGPQQVRDVRQTARKSLREGFRETGFDIPATHKEFRDLVKSLDLTKKSGREAYEILINLSDEFVTLRGTAEEVRLAHMAVRDSYNSLLFSTGKQEKDARKEAREALRDGFKGFDLSVPKTHKEFVQLIRAIDTSTTAGKKMKLVLQDLSDEFVLLKGTAEAARQANRVVRETFKDLMFTDSDKEDKTLQEARKTLRKTFRSFDLTVPKTHKEFVQLVRSIDTTTEAGKAMKLTLQGLADEFVLLKGTAEDVKVANQAIRATFQDLMFTDEQKGNKAQKKALEDLNEGFGKFGLAVPQTHKEFIQLVRSIDTSTAAGSAMKLTLQGLADEFVTVHGTAEEAAQSAKELSQQLKSNLSAAFDNFIRVVENAIDKARDSLDRAYQGVLNSIDAREESLTKAYEQRVTILNDRLEVSNEALALASGLFSLLNNAYYARNPVTDPGLKVQRSTALSYLQGNENDEDILRKSIDVLSQDSSGTFSTFFEFAKEQAAITNALKARNDVAEVELTEAQQTVDLLEDQLKLEERQHLQQLDSLENLRKEVTRQYQIATDQYEETLSIGESIKNLEDETNVYLKTLAELTPIKTEMENLVSIALGIDQSILSVSGAIANLKGALGAVQADPSTAELPLWARRELALATGSGNRDDLYAYEKRILTTPNKELNEWQKQQKEMLKAKGFATGGFHTGGLRMVGEDGPELEVTGAARIYSRRQTSEMFRDPELSAAVERLTEEVAQLRSENTQLLIANNKLVKKDYDLHRQEYIENQTT